MTTILTAVAMLIIGIFNAMGWWREHKIRIQEQERLTLAVKAAQAEAEVRIRQKQAEIEAAYDLRLTTMQAEYQAVKDDPEALVAWLNRGL